ncbi:MAG TPA: Smr/MutS family protein [Opitutaceae bacterium]|nr:Smr/MutS family protein [Opitutaceae bacterium]
MEESEEPIAIPILDEIDLHTFQPREIAAVLDAYFEACRAKGIRRVRVIHGKGIGTLRQTVQAHVRKSAHVVRFWNADESSGSWGATFVELVPRSANLDTGQNG